MGKPLSLPLEPKSNSAGIVILVVSPGACSEQLSSELSCYFQGEGGLTDRQTDRQPFPSQGKMQKSRHRLVQAGSRGAAALGVGASRAMGVRACVGLDPGQLSRSGHAGARVP